MTTGLHSIQSTPVGQQLLFPDVTHSAAYWSPDKQPGHGPTHLSVCVLIQRF